MRVTQAREPVPLHRPTAEQRESCPLVRAAIHLGDPRTLAVVARIHPALCCPAARRERAS
jgi:hypothetical protein